MRKLVYITLLSLVLLMLIGGAVACQSSPASIPNEEVIRKYADPATETILQGLSENDLAKYTQYGNAEFKAAVTQEILDEAAAQINGQLGIYQSKVFLSIEEQDGYIIVHYQAKYTEDEVGVRMVFDNDHLVAGQWFE
ncbi:DUF3887 domain-containing protein [Chloroflexota bacterium]